MLSNICNQPELVVPAFMGIYSFILTKSGGGVGFSHFTHFLVVFGDLLGNLGGKYLHFSLNFFDLGAG